MDKVDNAKVTKKNLRKLKEYTLSLSHFLHQLDISLFSVPHFLQIHIGTTLIEKYKLMYQS